MNATWLKDGIGEKYDENKKFFYNMTAVNMAVVEQDIIQRYNQLLDMIQASSAGQKVVIMEILRSFYSMLLVRDPKINFGYDYMVNIMKIFRELRDFVSNLCRDEQESLPQLDDYINKIKDSMNSIYLLKSSQTKTLINSNYGTGKTYSILKFLNELDMHDGIEDDRTGLYKMYSSLEETDQEEIITLMALKLKRENSIKRKKLLSTSEHGEEAATVEPFTKKMA